MPTEGKGMELVRRGHYEFSPPEEILDQPMELPPTRGALRGGAVKRMEAARVKPSAHWISVGGKTPDGETLSSSTLEPYATHDERIEALVELLAA